MDQNDFIENEDTINPISDDNHQFDIQIQSSQYENSHVQIYNRQSLQQQNSPIQHKESILYKKKDSQQYQIINQNENSNVNQQKFNVPIDLIQKNLTKIAFRCFFNRFMTYYIKSLKHEQQSIRYTSAVEIKKLKQQNWPFKQLFYKKNRNQEEQIMLQFINMCAQKIQAVFKGYIKRKRHVQAIKKIDKFKNNLSDIVKSWKLWNIYNCKRAKQLRNIVKSINLQIQRQIQNPNIDRNMKRKKIQYLNRNQEIAKQNFRIFFSQLYQSGAWIFEVEKCFKKVVVQKFNKKNSPYNFNKTEQQVLDIKPKIPEKRKRQFQAPRNKQKQIQQKKIQNFSQNSPSTQINKSHGLSTNFESISQERPIVSKGQYKFDQNAENEFLNQNVEINQKKIHKESQQDLDNSYQQKRKENIAKLQERKKLNKRQKYDPRKAIQEQKKKKLEQKSNEPEKILQKVQQKPKEKIQSKTNHSKTPTKLTKKTPIKAKKQQRRLQSPKQSSKQKTVEKVKKQNKLTKKDDNNKSLKNIFNPKKVASRVDCWGSKRDSNSIVPITNQQSSYKSKYLIGLKQKNEVKHLKTQGQQKDIGVNRLKNRFQRQYQSRQQQYQQFQEKQQFNQKSGNQATYQSSYLKRLVQQRQKGQKGSFSYTNKGILNIRIAERIKQPQINISERLEQPSHNTNTKRLADQINSLNIQKTNNFVQKIQKKIEPQHGSVNQNMRKKQQVYRPVESLQQVYSSQYTDRYNNLKNKLNMLQSTRYIQKDGSIPIMLEQARFMKKIFNQKQHSFSSLYWPQVRTMQTNFLEYIKFNVSGN